MFKDHEEKLKDVRQKLELQLEKENKSHNEILDSKQEVEICKKKIICLQENTTNNLIPELQNKIDVSKEVYNMWILILCLVRERTNLYELKD